LKFFILLAFFLFCFFVPSLSQEQVPEANIPIQVPESSPDIIIQHVFPAYPESKVIGGEPVEALISLTNTGDNVYKVLAITGSLRHPLDFRYIIQNYTASEYSVEIPPHQEISMSYTFQTWELEERDYFLLGEVYYQDAEDRQFLSAWYNGTFTLMEPPATVDGKTFFTCCAILAVLGLVGYFGYKTRSNLPTDKKKSRESKGKAAKDEWLAGTAAVNFGKPKKVLSKRR